ncbi:hypothetical protein BGW36DRAFT_421761 [Talaromyces proteolyticus]|uniref:Inhibitor I9 domain-containing protein n=1 Tax=Talaromyces proteolyticus TaxID=1131652 RepID=A0AAD4Q623_9EURO|nr:uncharacterized protein BGW36DRAFT_421761 [Talaromyces proteolyticus]KAH8705193.1 hypothetical protein BGW36DRAFT_421761 [Talaromyces proteolyticus]
MTLFNVTLKDSAPQEQLEKAKEEARKNGGTIKHEYKIIKGFTVEYPDDQVNVLETNEHIHVEQDGMVSTQ